MTLRKAQTSGLLLATIAALHTAAAWPAAAQVRYGMPESSTLLVTPEGDLLGFVPEAGEVIISRDRLGRRILLDHYGNLVATEVPSEAYYPRQRNTRYPAEYGELNDRRAAWNDQPGWQEDDVITGTVPAPGGIERQPLQQPGEGIFPDDDTPAMAAPQPAPAPAPHYNIIEPKGRSTAEITALQVFLDREGISPGVIDGKVGQNVNKAIDAWQKKTGETLDPNNVDDILERLRLSGGLAIMTYTITPGDAAGPFVAAIPEDYAHKAMLPALSYTSTVEMLAERFHMDENYLRALNPNVDFTIPGTIIKVVDVGQPQTGQVAKIVADKGRKQVFAYDQAGGLIAAYPASIGSSDTPSPSGTVTVERIALNPGYTYNPKINFKQGNNDKILNIPPGPNGPVGTVWMALSKPTYGIHGTPEPSKIGRTQSHGCIRLSNWDATELAKMVKPGVTVEFID